MKANEIKKLEDKVAKLRKDRDAARIKLNDAVAELAKAKRSRNAMNRLSRHSSRMELLVMVNNGSTLNELARSSGISVSSIRTKVWKALYGEFPELEKDKRGLVEIVRSLNLQ